MTRRSRDDAEARTLELAGRALHGGAAAGPLFVLGAPLSFWGGVDPASGVVADPRHPDHGARLGGRILVMERTIGSSSSSAVMLELLRNQVAPAGVVVGEPDAILVLGVLVADELGCPTIPFLEVGARGVGQLCGRQGAPAEIAEERLIVERRNRSPSRPSA